MNVKKSVARALAAGLVAAALSLPVGAEVIEQILVKVNGEIFTQSELEARQVTALRQMGQQVDANSNLSDAQLKRMLDEVTPRLIVSVVDEMILVQRGRELGYTMGEEQFKNIVDSIKKDNKIETEEQFQAALKQEGMTLVDLRRTLEKQMMMSRVQQSEVLSRVNVTDEELRKYYDEHRTEFTSAPTVTLREIFVALPTDAANATVAQDTEAREKAGQIRARAVAGENFEQLATELSDSPSKANAGLIGPLSLNDLAAEVRQLLEPMKPGDITGLLRGARGYQILKLESTSGAETKPFEEAREEIGNRIFNTKRQGEYQKYLEKMRSLATVEWKNPEMKKAYDLGLTQARDELAKTASTQ
jgi:peptidyl-prolyl cis-trans isomerase SurA